MEGVQLSNIMNILYRENSLFQLPRFHFVVNANSLEAFDLSDEYLIAESECGQTTHLHVF